MSKETFRKGITKYAQEELGMDEDQSDEYADLVEFVKNCHALELSRADMDKEASTELESSPYGRYIMKEAASGLFAAPSDELDAMAEYARENPEKVLATLGVLGGGTTGAITQLARGKGLGRTLAGTGAGAGAGGLLGYAAGSGHGTEGKYPGRVSIDPNFWPFSSGPKDPGFEQGEI